MHKKLFLAIDVGIIAVTLFVFATSAFADVKQDVAVLMEHIRNNEEVDDTAVRKNPPLEIIAQLDKYRNDPDESVQVSAADYTLGTAVRSGELPVVQAAVLSLLDTAAREPTTAVTRNAADRLLIFPRAAFTEEARQIVHQIFLAKEPEVPVTPSNWDCGRSKRQRPASGIW